jgi:hypothetical protein
MSEHDNCRSDDRRGHDGEWVEKVHPLSRDVEAEDPMELMAEPVMGDPQLMLECMLQEFAWMGWNEEQLVSMFYNPGYPVLCQLREHFGDEEIRRQVRALTQAWGRLQFRETIVEPDEEAEVDLVQITLPGRRD